MRLLKWLTLSLLAYFAVVMVVHVPLKQMTIESLQPWHFMPAHASLSDYAAMMVAVLGTTISPYLFFWQASQEVEDQRLRPDTAALRKFPTYVQEHLARIRLDTTVGMLLSNGVALSIVVATAVTLNLNGITEIQTSAQAAEALRPVAGDLAFTVFALGIIGTGLLAVPVLAGSAAYAVSEVLGWKASLSHGFHEARGFYGLIIAATGLGTVLGMLEVRPHQSAGLERRGQRRDLGAHHGRDAVAGPIATHHGRADYLAAPPPAGLGRYAADGRSRCGDAGDAVEPLPVSEYKKGLQIYSTVLFS